mmetsp:Transcript_18455/g.16324  ORF Transcript_18455/g.16324 Transcript_18455/m.16324 type:complete len:234 (-) Transcript_18455:64-765(-)|eukprot:CAMPEP_0205810862 /NCGR_PEP_ID=MMETSP0205-20121125/15011_1 /ASSEMBLY_ACC=CAM_ASM_000278 /TAXON_ID=36767 /ORGANISM="Euplotes focardii, Strain TN1" /LENGTH=233 /DNA_ID=CAMNT_0053089355 /DNA_START=12 /DNA_END=713 /DNA_ORIENTATION=+
MFTIENNNEIFNNNSNNIFETFNNNAVEEKDIKPQFEFNFNALDDNNMEQFILFDEKCTFEENSHCGNMTPTKEQSFLTDDLAATSNCNSNDTHIQVDFDGENINMDDFIFKIREEITCKGVNDIICEALDIKNTDEFSLEPVELIKVKKRKSKDQIKQLANEFAKNDDWSKEFMNKIAEKLNLEPAQVYKWHWDQISKKLGKAPKKQAKLQKQNKRKRAAKQASTKNKRTRN